MHDVIPKGFFDRLDFLRDMFSKAEIENCFLLMFGILFSPKKTINSMAEWLENINQSTLNRFLTKSDCNLKKLFKNWHMKIKSKVKNKVVKLIIDDSKIEKTGEEIERIGKEFDHVKKQNILCFSIVFSIVKIAGIELPLPFSAEACKKKNKKDKRKKSKIFD